MKPLFLVLAKLTGLLHLYWTVALLLQMAMMFSTLGKLGSPETGGTLGTVIATALYCVLAIWIGWTLLVRTDWLADKLGIRDSVAIQIPAPATLLLVGVQLIGVYVAVDSIPDLVRALIYHRTIAAHLRLFDVISNLLAPLILLLLGLFLAFRASRVVALVSRQENHSALS